MTAHDHAEIVPGCFRCEVARVLNLHASFKASAEIQDPNTPWYWECDGCDARLALSGTYGRPEVIAALANHQAAMLAEAGLLRSYDPDAECGVCGGTRDRAEMWRRIANRMDYALAEMIPTLRKIFSDATENERQMLDAFDVLIEQARDGKGDAQIAASVPAGQPSAGSAGRGGSGGLDGAPGGAWPFAPGDIVQDSGEDADHAAWLDAAPQKTVIVDHQGTEWTRLGDGWFLADAHQRIGKWASLNLEQTYGPLSVISIGREGA